MPGLVNVEAQQLKCGPEAVTPDGKYIMGRVPEVVSLSALQNVSFMF